VADFVYNRAATRIGSDALQLSTSTLKVMLVTDLYVANRDHDFIAAGGANDPDDHELNGVTNYTRGFGGAGRKTVANKVFIEDDANDRGEMDADDVLYALLGGVGQGNVNQALLVKENTNDADSELIAHYDSGFPKTLNGGDLTVVVNAEGLLQFSTV
jgi:hypothetical protein